MHYWFTWKCVKQQTSEQAVVKRVSQYLNNATLRGEESKLEGKNFGPISSSRSFSKQDRFAVYVARCYASIKLGIISKRYLRARWSVCIMRPTLSRGANEIAKLKNMQAASGRFNEETDLACIRLVPRRAHVSCNRWKLSCVVGKSR